MSRIRRIYIIYLARGLINIARVQRLLRAFVTLYAYACIPFQHVTPRCWIRESRRQRELVEG